MELHSKINETINESIQLKHKLLNHSEKIHEIGIKLAEVVKNGNKILFCGNGGSAADAQHLAAELVIRLRGHINRAAIGAMALTVDPSIITAGSNDLGFENVFAREVEAYGKPGDALVGISTSGNSENILRAVDKANELDMETIGLLGCGGGRIAEKCKYPFIVPADVTARIQECHILIGHIWCEMIEEYNYPEYFT